MLTNQRRVKVVMIDVHNVQYQSNNESTSLINDRVVTVAQSDDNRYTVIFRSDEDYTDVVCFENDDELKSYRRSSCIW